jgi:hypothetical protein
VGWEVQDLNFEIALRLDAHGGDKEREHEQLATELAEKLNRAVLAVLQEPQYRAILLFEPEFYVHIPENGPDG